MEFTLSPFAVKADSQTLLLN